MQLLRKYSFRNFRLFFKSLITCNEKKILHELLYYINIILGIGRLKYDINMPLYFLNQVTLYFFLIDDVWVYFQKTYLILYTFYLLLSFLSWMRNISCLMTNLLNSILIYKVSVIANFSKFLYLVLFNIYYSFYDWITNDYEFDYELHYLKQCFLTCTINIFTYSRSIITSISIMHSRYNKMFI